jgi:hypothetical protein
MRSERKILTVAEYAAKHLPNVVPAPATLYEIAAARMRLLFPRSKLVADLDRKLKIAAMIAARSRPCKARACPFPVVDERGWCRAHLADSVATCSVLPSMLGTKMIPQPRSHHAHA